MEKNNQSYKTIGEVVQEIGLINKKSKKINTYIKILGKAF